ncbi:MAG: hypothetical protein ABI759_10935 [Candidatus Solibacter sp.]
MNKSPGAERLNWYAGIFSFVLALWIWLGTPQAKKPNAEPEPQRTITTGPSTEIQKDLPPPAHDPPLKQYKDSYLSFTYPSDWDLQTQEKVVIIRSPRKANGRSIVLDFAPQPANQTIESLLGLYEDRYRKVAQSLGKEVSFLNEDITLGTHVGNTKVAVIRNSDTPSIMQTTLVPIGVCGYLAGGITANSLDGEAAESMFRRIMAEILDQADCQLPSVR